MNVDERTAEGLRAVPAWTGPRVRRTPFTERVEQAGVQAYTVYNRTLLPVVFESLEADYRHLRAHVQIWDVSCQRQVEIAGPEAASFVQSLTPRDLSEAQPGRCLYAPLVDADGGVVNDPVISVLGPDRFWLSIADGDIGLWASGLAQTVGARVDITEPDVHPLAVQGPKSDDLMARVFGDAVRDIRFFRFAWLPFGKHDLMVARTGWSHQGGFEIYVDDVDAALPLWDALWNAGTDLHVRAGCPNLIERIESGLLSYGTDITRDHNPFEARFERFCHLDRPIKFIGRAGLERIASAGPARKVVGVQIEGADLAPCTEPWRVTVRPAAGAADTVTDQGAGAAGAVTSAAVSPQRGRCVAIATVDIAAAHPGTVVSVDTPAGPRRGVVVDLPFPPPA